MFGSSKKGDDAEDAGKEDEEKKEDEDEQDDEEEDEEDSDSNDDMPDMDPDEFDENGQPYSERAINWSLSNFGDKSGTRFFKYAGDRTPVDIKEMRRKRRWRVNLKSVFYQHEWTGPENDIFLQFNIGYAFKLRKVQSYVKGPAGPKQKVVKLVPSGDLGDMFRTPKKSNIKLHEEVSFASLEGMTEQELSYLDLYEHYLRVEVWDEAAACPNTFLGEFQLPLVNIARGGLNHVWTISNTVMQKRKKVITDVAIVRFVCVFQEVLDFELRLQNWSAKLLTSMMRKETTKAEGDDDNDDDFDQDEELVRKPYMTFLLGQRKFFDPDSRVRTKLHHSFDKTFARSLTTALVYSHNDKFVLPTFRTLKRLCFRGTRTELEDQELRIKVFTEGGVMSGPRFVGEGSVSLEGAATGVSTTAPIAWTSSARQKGLDRYVAAGEVTGAVSVTAFRTPLFKELLQVGSGKRGAPLWREFLQSGNVQPPELKVYKPYEYCYLCVKIVNCRGLAAVDDDGASDPYVMCVWAGQAQKTSVHFATLDPEYNETLYFRIRSFNSDMPTSTELAKHPYVRITVWDYDEGGSSDDLGVGKFYLHNITGASRIHHAEAENSEDASMDDFKPNAPRKRTVMVRDRESGPLRQRTIMTRTHKTRIKLEGLPSHLSSTVKLEAWFQGPGFVDERGKPQVYSKNSRPMKLRRGGDLLENDMQIRKLNQSNLLYLPRYESMVSGSKGRAGGGEQNLDEQGNLPLDEQCQAYFDDFQGALALMEENHHRRTQRMNDYFPVVYGVSQYGQKFLLPQFVQAMPVPAPLFADEYERERTVCIDSRKPQTCWNIHRFVHNIEWTFPDMDSREFSDQMGGTNSWVSPEYFVDMKKAGITGHAILLCSLFIGLKVDAWVCVGRANIEDAPGADDVGTGGGRGRGANTLPADTADTAGSGGGGADDRGAAASGQSKESVDYSVPFEENGKEKWHVWVMTRESKSHNCLYQFPEGSREREKGSVKFWDSTCATGHLCPTLANRWEGIADEDAAYLAALGSKVKRSKKVKKAKVKKRIAKHAHKRVDLDDSDSDEDPFVPDEIEMLSYDHGSKLQEIDYRTDHRVEVSQLFHTSAGIGTTWGKPNHSDMMAEKKQADEDSAAADEKEKALAKEKKAKKRKAAMSKHHSERIAWIQQNDNYNRVIDEGRCKYIELYSVFNDKQLFLNVQDSLSPLQIGYDFEFGVNGGWLPLFLPDSKGSRGGGGGAENNDNGEAFDPFGPTGAGGGAGEAGGSGGGEGTNQGGAEAEEQDGSAKKKVSSGDTLIRPRKGILLPECCRLTSLGPPTSKDHVAENTIHIVEELISAITNYREARNMPSRWDGNDSISRFLLRAIKCKTELERCAKVDKNGWDVVRGEWRKTFPEVPPYTNMIDKKGNVFYQTMNVLVEHETDKGEKVNKVIKYTKGWFLKREYKKSLKVLCTSPPLGYDFNLIFINSLDTDPKTIRRGIIERKFKGPDGMPRDAPWDIDRPGTQFAVACDIEIFPNVNNLVRLAFMTIYPKTPGGKEAPNKAEGAEGDFMNNVVNDGSETDESRSDGESGNEDDEGKDDNEEVGPEDVDVE